LFSLAVGTQVVPVHVRLGVAVGDPMTRAPASMACPTLFLGLGFRLRLVGNAGLFGRDNALNDNCLGRLLLRRHLEWKIGLGWGEGIRFYWAIGSS